MVVSTIAATRACTPRSWEAATRGRLAGRGRGGAIRRPRRPALGTGTRSCGAAHL